jgi:hypothetical protein
MGAMSLWMVPFFLFWGAIERISDWIGAIAPAIGIVIGALSAIAALLSLVVLLIAARRPLRSERRWVRVAGWIIVTLEALATPAFAIVAIVAFVAVAAYA